jgi:hypothetical protein
MDGTDQRTMAGCGGPAAAGESAGRWPWAALARPAHGVQRGALGFADGCAVEGFVAAIRFILDRASALPTMGAFGRHGNGIAGAGRTSAAGRRTGFAGMFCGRNLRAGQKRGRRVGKTKRGKGTKIMGIADGHGLPLALWTTSASPAEVKLVAATLEARFVPEVPERLIGDKAYASDRLVKPYWNITARISSRPTKSTAGFPRRMAARCAATSAAGKSSACLPGSSTSAGWLSVTNTTRRISKGLFIWRR